NPVDRRAVTQVSQAQLAHQLEVLFPKLVVTRRFQFINAHAALDRRARALDPDGKHEADGVDGIGDVDRLTLRWLAGHGAFSPAGRYGISLTRLPRDEFLAGRDAFR